MKIGSIDIVHDIGADEFREKYLLSQKPVVIKGFASKTEAGKKWDIHYIKNVCGEVEVDIFDNNNSNAASAFTKPDFKMKFADYADAIMKGEATSFRMFLFNMFKHKPELRRDFPCPEIFNGILGRIGFMFFGTKGIKVRVHQDIDMSNVLLTQFYGRKRVVLVSPEYSTLLYRLPFNTHSLVDLDNPDYYKYPGLQYIEKQECILEPGDSLFMPSGYWHYITYLDGGFAVSYRKMASGLKYKASGCLFFMIYMPFDKLMNILFGKKWLRKKERISFARANKVIERVNKNCEEVVVQFDGADEFRA